MSYIIPVVEYASFVWHRCVEKFTNVANDVPKKLYKHYKRFIKQPVLLQDYRDLYHQKIYKTMWMDNSITKNAET